jgi:hypothetical protein
MILLLFGQFFSPCKVERVVKQTTSVSLLKDLIQHNRKEIFYLVKENNMIQSIFYHRYPKLSISGFEITVNVWDFPYWSKFENIEILSDLPSHYSYLGNYIFLILL